MFISISSFRFACSEVWYACVIRQILCDEVFFGFVIDAVVDDELLLFTVDDDVGDDDEEEAVDDASRAEVDAEEGRTGYQSNASDDEGVILELGRVSNGTPDLLCIWLWRELLQSG